MGTRRPEIKPDLMVILERYHIDPDDDSQLWSVHGTLVLYHRAYELIAAQECIQWVRVDVLEHKVQDREFSVAILAEGRMGERSEWAIGECSNLNYQGKGALYPYAMAEKRSKDRAIAKLVGLSAQGVYSEEEADDFRRGGYEPTPAMVEGAKLHRDLVSQQLPHPQGGLGPMPTGQMRAPPPDYSSMQQGRSARPEPSDPIEVAGTVDVPDTPKDWADWERRVKTAVDNATHLGDLKVLWARQEPAITTLRTKFSGQYRAIVEHFSTKRDFLERLGGKHAG